MSNPLSSVPPPAALPSFVTQPSAPLSAGPVPSCAPASTSAMPPGTSAPPAAVLAPPAPLAIAPPMPVPVMPVPGAPQHPALPPVLRPGPGQPPPPPMGLQAAAPAGAASGAPPPPPPMGAATIPLSASGQGHMSRPKYVPPPDIATTGAPGPAPMLQPGVLPTPSHLPPAAQLTPDSVLSAPAVGVATVDYAQTPMVQTSIASLSLGGETGSAADHEGWLGWIKDTVQRSEVLSKVAERARSSMDSIVTTLDPQMRDIIYSGGDLDVVVASDKEVKVSAVREAFQTVFGKATVVGVPVPGAGAVPQPTGIAGARAAAGARLQAVRQAGLVPAHQTVVAVEGFLAQLEQDRWYDMSLLVLDEPGQSPLSTLTQPVEVPLDWVQRMQAASPADHPQAADGLQLSVGQVAASTLQVSPSAWHELMCGMTRRQLLVPAARALAHQYRTRRGA